MTQMINQTKTTMTTISYQDSNGHASGNTTIQNFSSAFPILSSFGKIITADSDTTVCVQEEKIREIATIINSLENRNLFLRGKAGTGKTATVHALAKYIASGKCGARIKNMVIAQIDISLLKSNGNCQSAMEKSIKDIWNEAKRNGNVILFLDEGHRIVDGNSDSIGNILKPLVTSGDVPVILATTDDEFRKYVDPDLAIRRRFHSVHIPEPDAENLNIILKSKGDSFSKRLNIRISEEIYTKTIELANRYIHETANPDKSIRLLERACSATSLREEGGEVAFEDLETALKIISNVKLPSIQDSFTDVITETLRTKIKGQDVATKKAGEFISQRMNGLLDSDIPPTLAFIGHGGCGKTALAKEMAKQLGYSKEEIIEIKMSNLRGYNAMVILLGNMNEKGKSVPGTLTEPVRKNPNRFLIIDEIEKMPEEVISVFEQMVTNGSVLDHAGNDVCFKNTVVAFIGDICKSTKLGFSAKNDSEEETRKQEEEIYNKLQETFSGDFCVNINTLVPFMELSKSVIVDVVRSICRGMPNLKIKFDLSDGACEYVAELCGYRKHGAREIRGKLGNILRNLSTPFIQKGITEPLKVILENGKLCVSQKEEAEVCQIV